MALTLNANWLRAVTRADWEPVLLVTITAGTGTWKALSGLSDTMTYPASVISVTSLAAEMHPIKRTLEIGGVTVVFEDAWIRDIIVANRLFGQKVTVEIGARELAEGDYEGYFVGQIEAIFPEDGATVRVECTDVLEVLRSAYVFGRWISAHPLEVVEDILTNKANLTANEYDVNSVDPAHADNAAIRHFVVSRWTVNAVSISNAVGIVDTAFNLIQQIGELVVGGIIVGEDGKFKFKIFDATAAAVKQLTVDDIDEFKQIALEEYVVNHVAVKFHPQSVLDSAKWFYEQEDTDSQTNFAYPGTAGRKMSHEIKTFWLDGITKTLHPLTAATVIPFFFTMRLYDMCGMGGTLGPNLDANHPAYYRLVAFGTDTPTEVIKVTNVKQHWFDAEQVVWEPSNFSYQVESGLTSMVWVDITRAQLGTAARAHEDLTRLIDITIPEYVSRTILNRAANGLAKIELTTSMIHFDLQLGDFITIDGITEYLMYGRDGINNTDKWEIVRKEVDIFASPPAIRLTLAAVNALTQTQAYRHGVAPVGGANAGLVMLAGDEEVGENYVNNGFAVAQTGGLAGTVDPGVITSTAGRTEVPKQLAKTFTATKDTYIFVDALTATVRFAEVAPAAAAPDKAQQEVHIAVVTTDGAGITAIDEGDKPLRALNGGKLMIETVGHGDALNVESPPGASLLANFDFASFSRG